MLSVLHRNEAPYSSYHYIDDIYRCILSYVKLATALYTTYICKFPYSYHSTPDTLWFMKASSTQTHYSRISLDVKPISWWTENAVPTTATHGNVDRSGRVEPRTLSQLSYCDLQGVHWRPRDGYPGKKFHRNWLIDSLLWHKRQEEKSLWRWYPQNGVGNPARSVDEVELSRVVDMREYALRLYLT